MVRDTLALPAFLSGTIEALRRPNSADERKPVTSERMLDCCRMLAMSLGEQWRFLTVY